MIFLMMTKPPFWETQSKQDMSGGGSSAECLIMQEISKLHGILTYDSYADIYADICGDTYADTDPSGKVF